MFPLERRTASGGFRTPAGMMTSLLVLIVGALTFDVSIARSAVVAHQAADVNPGPSSSDPDDMASFGGNLYFAGRMPGKGHELVRLHNGKPQLVADLNPGKDSSSPRDFIRFKGMLYFSASTEASGRELWRTGGNTTEIVADLRPGSESSDPFLMTVLGDQLLFRAAAPHLAEQFT
ncbi:MAG TPA: hypothetical protein P5138_11755, partial [Solirubrobacterales bacterium]|nr:hypothetical protein [Solirubrobacterales bacterium]